MENFDKPFFGRESIAPTSTNKIKKLAKSKKNWSLELLEITLHPSFGGLVNQIFGREEKIHFVSISWDFGGLKSNLDTHLNFVGNCSPMELSSGKSHTYKNDGLNLFPPKIVHDSLNIALFVFKNKDFKNPIDPLMDEIGKKINASLLSQELIELTEENSFDRKEYINFLAEQLKVDIVNMINENQAKHISTFCFKFDTSKETKFTDTFYHLQDLVRVSMKKSKF